MEHLWVNVIPTQRHLLERGDQQDGIEESRRMQNPVGRKPGSQ